MKLKIIKLTTLFFFLALCLQASTQPILNDYPIVGQPIPEFTLTNVHYYSKKVFDSRGIKGKWVILDFWNTACVVCVRSFPKINELHTEFKENIQFLLIGQNNKRYYGNIEQVFDKYKKKLELSLPIAYDSILVQRFGIQAMPHVIIVDPQGIVYAITHSKALTHESLQALIENKRPMFVEKSDVLTAKQKPHWNYLVDDDNIKHNDFLYRSILAENKGEGFGGSEIIDDRASQGIYQISRTDLPNLYKIAWFGKANWVRWDSLYATHWRFPILEISDSSLFSFDYYTSTGTGLYNYSLTMPKNQARKERLMEIMQRDLKNYFGYEVSIEIRTMPYWRLTATAEARKKLISNNNERPTKVTPTGIDGSRLAMETIISQIMMYNGEHIPYLDETDITEPIDINFSATMTDITDVQKALRKHGLNLEKSKKDMQVLVIRDPKPETKGN